MGAGRTDDLLERGRAALAAADWELARACFEQALALEESAEAAAGLGDAAHWLREYDRALALKERAFALYHERGLALEAAEQARTLAFLHGAVHGNDAVANGWFARAESVLADVGECVQHGWLAFERAPLSRDPAERERLAGAALAIARRYGDTDLEHVARALLGEAYVQTGRVAEGMTLIDEAMAAVSAGEVRAIVAIGDIYCRLLSACERADDVRRAEQWMAVAEGFAERTGSVMVSTTCRLHYGGILVATGRWPEAERELVSAIGAAERGYRAMRVFPLVRLADLRVRQGRFEEAERLLEGSEWHPTARRALATIALARGALDVAEAQLRLCLDAEDPADPACVELAALLVEVRLAGGDAEGARAALERLRPAVASGSERALACAELAEGRVLAAAGDERAAVRLQGALGRFAALDLPLEAARARLELARVLAARTPEAGSAEARLALGTFERLGAARDADAAAGLLRELGTGGRTWPRRYGALTKRETEVLALLAAGASNADIAARLFISPRTAEHHVASILSKLDLRSRAEAAAYAVREPPRDP